jgi:hypothetical protein
LLCQKRVPQVGRPLDVARHPLHHVRKLNQTLDTGVPGLLCHRVCQRFALQILIVIHPLLKLDYFQWISRSGEGLRQKRIGVECDRSNERIQLLRWKFSCLLVIRCGRHLLRLRLLRERGGAQCKTNDGDHAVN